jgi:hypothetical protein
MQLKAKESAAASKSIQEVLWRLWKMRQIELRRGGWFVTDELNGFSGPWKSKEAAEAAEAGDFDEAHRLNNRKPENED